MRERDINLTRSRIPGTSGTEFCELELTRRTMVVSSPASDQVVITVGCYSLHLKRDEAIAVARAVLTAAGETGEVQR